MMLFRNRPALVVELLRDAFAFRLPAHARVTLEPEKLRAPIDLAADAVVALEGDRKVFAVIVEVQLGRDADKRRSWPCYVANLRHQLSCPTMLVVVTVDDAIARWCREPIELGHPGFTLRPVVIGRDAIPRVTDEAVALADLELAVLSSIVHGPSDERLEVLAPTTRALESLPVDDARTGIYTDLILQALKGAPKRVLEALMKTGKYEYGSDFALHYIGVGRAEGEAKGEAQALLRVLARRGFAVDRATEQRVLSCADLELLGRWIDRAVTARTLEEVFADG
ncbi:MAG: hypothetical protein HYV09_20700 [Deltaproteobacteria bacterium]|nr:hypothetical protein [Deltaproteobacteria bacterium]